MMKFARLADKLLGEGGEFRVRTNIIELQGRSHPIESDGSCRPELYETTGWIRMLCCRLPTLQFVDFCWVTL